MSEQTSQVELSSTAPCAPRLYAFPRLDLIRLTSATGIDDLLHRLRHMTPEVFASEEAAEEFHKQHLATHHAPIYQCCRHRHTGAPFTGPRLTEYHATPAENWVRIQIDFVLDSPVRCTLAEDWQFRSMEIIINQKRSHKTVRRHPAHPDRELLEALCDLEAELYQRHKMLTADALRDFWSSFEIHRHLTQHALKMERYRDDYSAPIIRAMHYVRRHMTDYVAEILAVDPISVEPKRAHPDLVRKIQSLKADMGATVEELEALFNLDRKSLRKIELGKSILQSTIDKSPASRDLLPSLKSRLAENRKQKYRLK